MIPKDEFYAIGSLLFKSNFKRYFIVLSADRSEIKVKEDTIYKLYDIIEMRFRYLYHSTLEEFYEVVG